MNESTESRTKRSLGASMILSAFVRCVMRREKPMKYSSKTRYREAKIQLDTWRAVRNSFHMKLGYYTGDGSQSKICKRCVAWGISVVIWRLFAVHYCSACWRVEGENYIYKNIPRYSNAQMPRFSVCLFVFACGRYDTNKDDKLMHAPNVTIHPSEYILSYERLISIPCFV